MRSVHEIPMDLRFSERNLAVNDQGMRTVVGHRHFRGRWQLDDPQTFAR